MGNNNIVKLDIFQLKNIISESVKNVLKETFEDSFDIDKFDNDTCYQELKEYVENLYDNYGYDSVIDALGKLLDEYN